MTLRLWWTGLRTSDSLDASRFSRENQESRELRNQDSRREWKQRGYSQIDRIDYYGVLSPVVKHTSILLILSIFAIQDLELEKTFSHGNLNEMIYITQHNGFYFFLKSDLESNVCLLKKSLYILKQSLRQWYKWFDDFYDEPWLLNEQVR